jgi:Flp pilus assembly protein TadG
MPSPAAPSIPSGNLLRRFRRNRNASAAVEFALVAPVFFALLFAIIETALMFFASQVLETITQDSARVLMTGQAQSGQVGTCADPVSGAPLACTQATFKNYVCGQIPALFNCNSPNGIFVDVENYPQFTNVAINSQVDSSGNFLNNMQYNPGGACAIVVVRLFYQWPLFVTGLGYNIANMSGNKRLLSATAAFMNEPYGGGSCG